MLLSLLSILVRTRVGVLSLQSADVSVSSLPQCKVLGGGAGPPKRFLSVCLSSLCLSLVPVHPQEQWDDVKRQVQELSASSQYSNQPAIYGMVAGAEAARLRGEVPGDGECTSVEVPFPQPACTCLPVHVVSV